MNGSKVCFVIPFVAKEVARDWERACRLLECGLRSILALPSDFADVLVVGHDRPDITTGDRVEFRKVDFPMPDMSLTRPLLLQAKARDKGRKLEIGTQLAAERRYEWLMFFDHDDLVSRKLPGSCDLDRFDAICLDKGWKWHFGSARLLPCNSFDRICGSSMLLRLTKSNFPVWLGGAKRDDSRVGERGHNARRDSLLKAGAKVQVIRKRVVVYTVENGSNYYYENAALSLTLKDKVRALYHMAFARGISVAVRREFSIPSISL